MATKSKPKAKPTRPAANGVPVPPPAEGLTLAEAAAFLRVPEDGLRADAALGRVPGRLVAGEWRFGKAQLLQWLGRPSDTSEPTATNRELADHIRRFAPSGESEQEVEAFISKI